MFKYGSSTNCSGHTQPARRSVARCTKAKQTPVVCVVDVRLEGADMPQQMEVTTHLPCCDYSQVAEVLEGIQEWKQKTEGSVSNAVDNVEHPHQQGEQRAKGEGQQQQQQAREANVQETEQQQPQEPPQQQQRQQQEQQPLVPGGSDPRLLRGEGTSQGHMASDGGAGPGSRLLGRRLSGQLNADRNQGHLAAFFLFLLFMLACCVSMSHSTLTSSAPFGLASRDQ